MIYLFETLSKPNHYTKYLMFHSISTIFYSTHTVYQKSLVLCMLNKSATQLKLNLQVQIPHYNNTHFTFHMYIPIFHMCIPQASRNTWNWLKCIPLLYDLHIISTKIFSVTWYIYIYHDWSISTKLAQYHHLLPISILLICTLSFKIHNLVLFASVTFKPVHITTKTPIPPPLHLQTSLTHFPAIR